MSSTAFRTAPEASTRMPGGIPYIIGNEAAERFSFYGMKGILVVFMTQYLHMMPDEVTGALSDAKAKEWYHYFTSAVYFFPILGALIADSFLGKYYTIMILSVVYCLGHAALAFMGHAGMPATWLFAGLVLIAVGSGGVKPCVSAHVGDQFGKTNSHLLSTVFNWFYMSINFGAFLSGLLTPLVLKWYGPHWAFGIPGVLMAIATLLFWMGRHKFVHIPARGMAMFRELFGKEALTILLKLSVIFIFVAVFWALFEQTGSSWVQQAADMDRRWLGITWLPSQIQALNPVFILLFVPIFTLWLYPALNRLFKLTAMRKIAIGLFVMVLGFGLVAYAQGLIDQGQTPSIGWQVVAYALLTASEVFVSITCLEFAYTQSPRTMKSVVLALFLMSVSLGNFFTAGVNRYIQLPDLAASESVDLETITNEPALVEGTERITAFVNKEERLPSLSEGEELLAGLTDAWGEAVQYRQVNRILCRVHSTGADKQYMTAKDVGHRLVFDLPDPRLQVAEVEGESEAEAGSETRKTWLEKRSEALGVNVAAPVGEAEVGPTITPFAGGLVRLEGQAYFWFFTKLMLGTAILFLFVSRFYTPRTYLQDEA